MRRGGGEGGFHLLIPLGKQGIALLVLGMALVIPGAIPDLASLSCMPELIDRVCTGECKHLSFYSTDWQRGGN